MFFIGHINELYLEIKGIDLLWNNGSILVMGIVFLSSEL